MRRSDGAVQYRDPPAWDLSRWGQRGCVGLWKVAVSELMAAECSLPFVHAHFPPVLRFCFILHGRPLIGCVDFHGMGIRGSPDIDRSHQILNAFADFPC